MMGGVYTASASAEARTGVNLVNNPPANRTFSVGPCAGCTIDNLGNVLGGALFSPVQFNAVEVSSHTPTIYNFTLGVQQTWFQDGDGSQLCGIARQALRRKTHNNQVPMAPTSSMQIPIVLITLTNGCRKILCTVTSMVRI